MSGKIMEMPKLRHKNSGAASLITVIFVSIILSIVVVGFVRVAVNESRQSTDDDLTSRAFYAAESGLEEAKRALREFFRGNITNLNDDTCDVPSGLAPSVAAFDTELSPPDEFDTEYTCMIIDATPPNFEASLAEGETAQIELQSENDVSFTEVLVEWHINDALPDGDGASPNIRNSDKSLPKDNVWGTNNYPAMLRSYMFSYPDSGITRANLANYDVLAFLNPATSAESAGGLNYNSLVPGSSGSLGVYDAECDPSVSAGEYVCSVLYRVSGGSGQRNHVLRLTSLYTGTHVRVTLGNSPVVSVPFSGQQALVDITGRAGDVFRRVETRVDISSDFGDLLPDAGIISADDICKNLSLTDSPGDFVGNNCTGP